MDVLIVLILSGLIAGALFGLIPFFIGRYQRRPNMGKLALICCVISGVLTPVGPLVACIGFVIAILVSGRDSTPMERPDPVPPPCGPTVPAAPGGAVPSGALGLSCLAGPLRGRVYRIGSAGMVFGRDASCGVRFPADTPGISGRHCCIRWERGAPVLVDLGSTYGTFLGDGRQLPPNYPVELRAGTRFFLGSGNNLFQITLV